LWASFAEREPNTSSQLGVAERSALSEASAGTKNREIFKINSRARCVRRARERNERKFFKINRGSWLCRRFLDCAPRRRMLD